MTMEPATQPTEAIAPKRKTGSGYRRLQNRHRALIADHEALLVENAALTYQQQQLQQDIDRLLEQHGRLMQNARAPSQAQSWFESANLVLAQLAANPDPRAVQIFVAALAQLQVRLNPIVARTPL